MSSTGSQWRLIRHYLSNTNINGEIEKLLQKLKPISSEQWDSMVQQFEKMISTKVSNDLSPADENIRKSESKKDNTQKDAPEIKKTSLTTKDEVKKQIGDKVDSERVTINEKDRELSLESILQGLRLKKDLHFGKLSDGNWKTDKPTVSKQSIHARTAYVISAIVTAETPESLLTRTDSFMEHLRQYPEARDYAIKEGGVRALLRVQRRMASATGAVAVEVQGTVKEALALMGYSAPCKGPGPNILSIDGGGIRGLIAIEILKHLEKLTGKRVTELFDYIVGVSTGAIIAGVLASGAGNLDIVTDMYHTLSKKMFGGTSLISGTSRLVWSQAYYDTEAWEQILTGILKDVTLTACNRRDHPKLALVSCVVNSGWRLTPFLFRSYELPFRVRSVFPGTSNAKVWQAIRASAAAPTYFQEFNFNGFLHQDGGIMVNNPSGVGLHEARLIYGLPSLQEGCLVSIGTGKALNKHLDYQMLSKMSSKEAPSTSWKDKFNKILDSATDTEGVHLVLNDLLPAGGYFRFNPPLMQECAMDEINQDKLNALIVDTHSHIRRNKQKFQQAAARLTRKRPLSKKIVDYVQYQSQIMGIGQNY